MVCESPDLQRVDEELNALYRIVLGLTDAEEKGEAKVNTNALKAQQRQWHKAVATACADPQTCRQAYETRLAELRRYCAGGEPEKPRCGIQDVEIDVKTDWNHDGLADYSITWGNGKNGYTTVFVWDSGPKRLRRSAIWEEPNVEADGRGIVSHWSDTADCRESACGDSYFWISGNDILFGFGQQSQCGKRSCLIITKENHAGQIVTSKRKSKGTHEDGFDRARDRWQRTWVAVANAPRLGCAGETKQLASLKAQIEKGALYAYARRAHPAPASCGSPAMSTKPGTSWLTVAPSKRGIRRQSKPIARSSSSRAAATRRSPCRRSNRRCPPLGRTAP